MRRESAKSTKRADAVALLKKRLAEIGAGKRPGTEIEKTTFEDLNDIILADYKANRRRSISRLKGSLKHLEDYFAFNRAMDITSDRITGYTAHRQDEGAANATINRELAALKHAFRLAHGDQKVGEVAYIAMLEEDNVRTGFFDRAELDAVLEHLPP